MATLLDHPEFLRVLDRSADGAVAVSLDKRILYINDRARRILGYGPGEALQTQCEGALHSTECGHACLFNRALATGEDVGQVDAWYRTKNGHQVYALTHLVLLRDESGKAVVGLHLFSEVSRILHLKSDGPDARFVFEGIIGRNGTMREVFESIRLVAATSSSVLVTGESGTGKELVASAIHHLSPRSRKPFIRLNCAALNEGVLESELFGHVRGAFTGAVGDKKGRFEAAHGGTLFLDEIGEIPPSTQVKLLRVLQEGEFERVGSSQTLRSDVRMLAATNRDLREAMDHGRFRQDLFYRLNVFRIQLPPLRERKDDIPLLVDHFLKKVALKVPGKDLQGIEAPALSLLMNYAFPGNIRELENLIEHAAIRCQDGILRAMDLPLSALGNAPGSARAALPGTLHQIRTPMENLERDAIVGALQQCAWRVGKSAERLGVSRVTLWRKMKEYDIQRPGVF